MWRNSIAGGSSAVLVSTFIENARPHPPPGRGARGGAGEAWAQGGAWGGHGRRLSNASRTLDLAPPDLASILAVVVGHVVVDDDLAGNDVGLGLLDLGLHLRRDQFLIILVVGPVDAAFLESEHGDPPLP